MYRVSGVPTHIRWGGGRKGPLPCVARIGIGGREQQCRAISAYLCDWPAEQGDGTCSAPLCDAHARLVGRSRHFCPVHHQRALQPDGEPGGAQLGLFSGLLEAQ